MKRKFSQQLAAMKAVRKAWDFNPIRVVPDKTKYKRKDKFQKRED